jgi:hypothetical protein
MSRSANRIRTRYSQLTRMTIERERGHTYTPDNGGADRLVAEEMK